MTKDEAIKFLQQLYPNGGHCWLDEQRIEAIDMAVKALQEEPVSDDLEEAANFYANTHTEWFDADNNPHVSPAFKTGAKWQKEHLWKPADGDDLPEYEREVVVLEGNVGPTATDCFYGYKVVFAHRPNPNGWDGKSIATGNIEHYTPKTYGEGGWNIPNIVYWLDVELLKEIEL